MSPKPKRKMKEPEYKPNTSTLPSSPKSSKKVNVIDEKIPDTFFNCHFTCSDVSDNSWIESGMFCKIISPKQHKNTIALITSNPKSTSTSLYIPSTKQNLILPSANILPILPQT